MNEFLVKSAGLSDSVNEMKKISGRIDKENQTLENIGRSLGNSSEYKEVSKVILHIGQENQNISKKVNHLGVVLEDIVKEYGKAEKKIMASGKNGDKDSGGAHRGKSEVADRVAERIKRGSDDETQYRGGRIDPKINIERPGTPKPEVPNPSEPAKTQPQQPTVTSEGNGNPVGEPKNGWLQFYDGPTVQQDGRQVMMPQGNNPNKWAMREGLDTINKYAKIETEGSNTVVQGANGALVDSEGRYWVAVGPNVMNPDHQGNQKCTAAEMKYGTKIDVVVTDANGNKCYIPCVVGDCKAHTYPNGIYQTGDAFPNGTDSHPQNNDGSVVEFCGKGSIKGFGDYAIESIIVYE